MLLGSFLPVIHSLPSPISGSEMSSQPQNPDEDPQQQLWGAVGAVFGSWMNQRAKTYRKLHDIPEDACGERMVLMEGVLRSFVRMFLLRRAKIDFACSRSKVIASFLVQFYDQIGFCLLHPARSGARP